MKHLFSLLLIFASALATAQEQPELKFYPPNWWTAMPEQEFQLMIYGISSDWDVTIENVGGVKIKDRHSVDNPNYLFLDIEIPTDFNGNELSLIVKKGDISFKVLYELRKRENSPNDHRGITSSDLIYLIFPDRFANGNKANDVNLSMTDTRVLRDSLKTRHGGDIQGMRDKLFHFRDLGATAVWINPLLTNDQPWESYHGYAITDHYQVDPRFGSLAEYKLLVDECHRSGIKVIMDVVFNHVGANHDLIKNLPARDWINEWDGFQKTSYRAPTLMDPYASDDDRKIMSEGWFDYHMPDLNQKNELLAKFLVQNSIWWIETTGIDSYRVDTYAYSDPEFMQKWANTIKKFYPSFNFFGETWVHGSPIQAHFTQNNNMNGDFNTELPAVTDFQLYYAINDALGKPQGWTDGVAKLYYTMTKDFVYEDPNRNVVFLDNHDLSRFYSMVGEDFDKWKMGIGWLLTTRGIPMIYYGTEILMTGHTDPDAKVRTDYPGGWQEDQVDKFTAEGRSELENEAFNYIKKLADYRRKSKAIRNGKLMQFVPKDGVYIYFRYTDAQTVMIVMNTSEENSGLDLERLSERIRGYTEGRDVISGKETILEQLEVAPKSTAIFELF